MLPSRIPLIDRFYLITRMVLVDNGYLLNKRLRLGNMQYRKLLVLAHIVNWNLQLPRTPDFS